MTTTYVNRREAREVETVDEFSSRREAVAMVAEYQFADPSAYYYTSTRSTRDWAEKG